MKITTSDRRAASIDRETPSSHLIDDYVLERISFRARQLAIKFRLPDDRRDDLSQEMVVELLKAANRFDPDGSATWHTYASRVLDLAVKKFTQNECRTWKREAGRSMRFSQSSDGSTSVVSNTASVDDWDQIELRMDVELVLERMPARLQKTCRLLMQMSPSEAAEELGFHRNSIYRHTAQIREYFKGPKLGFCDSGAADSASVRM